MRDKDTEVQGKGSLRKPETKLNSIRNLEGGLAVLQVLFKEVLQQMPPEKADELAEGYHGGKNIMLVIGVSSYGKHCKTAFGWKLSDDQGWRGLPEAIGPVTCDDAADAHKYRLLQAAALIRRFNKE
jgi:hypothetical protein